jgi:hypothetical protein
MSFEIPSNVVNLIIKSLAEHPDEWIVRGEMIIYKNDVFIGNYHIPEALIIHGRDMKFGVQKGTISQEQANRICTAATEFVTWVFRNNTAKLEEILK